MTRTSCRPAPLVSAIVVTYDRARMVSACIESVLRQSEARLEIIVVLNGASDSVERIVKGHAATDDRVRLIVCPKTSASEARNAAVAASRAPLLYFLDDDVEVPEQGIASVTSLFDSRRDVAIAGGPNLTPPDDPPFAQLAGELLASPFGTGITRPRYTPTAAHPTNERHLTLCNLAVRRNVFTGGTSLPSGWGGEENVLMGRAARLGHRLWYAPELWVYHRRRFTLRGHLSQIRRYGFGRGVAIHSAPGTFHLAYFMPVGLLLYLLATPALAPLWSWGALFPLGLYGLAALTASVPIATRRRRWADLIGLPPLFAMTHLAYALGLIRGLARSYGSSGTRVPIAPSGPDADVAPSPPR